MWGHDVIHLRGLEFYAYHGVNPEENVLGQKFIVDADLFLNLQTAGYSDKMSDTVNYAQVYELIAQRMLGEPVGLLEHLAEQVAGQILKAFACQAVRLEIHKPQAPLAGIFQDVSVEIWREQEGAGLLPGKKI
jgi:dihydroneopterin aldolase